MNIIKNTADNNIGGVFIMIYFVWIFICFTIFYNRFVLDRKFDLELFSGTLVCIILSMYNVRTYYQIIFFLISYLIISFTEFIRDVIL